MVTELHEVFFGLNCFSKLNFVLKIPCSAATTTVLSGQIFSHVWTAKILHISNKSILLTTLHLLSVYLDGTILGALFVGVAYEDNSRIFSFKLLEFQVEIYLF